MRKFICHLQNDRKDVTMVDVDVSTNSDGDYDDDGDNNDDEELSLSKVSSSNSRNSMRSDTSSSEIKMTRRNIAEYGCLVLLFAHSVFAGEILNVKKFLAKI